MSKDPYELRLVKSIEVTCEDDTMLERIAETLSEEHEIDLSEGINQVETDLNRVYEYMLSSEPGPHEADGRVHEAIEAACGYAAEHDIEEIRFTV